MQQQQAYDPRLRNDVARTGNVHLFDELDIPSSTMRTWRSRGQVKFVTLEPDEGREADLRDRLQRTERKLLVARAKIVLLTTVLRVLGVSLENLRLPAALAKKKLLRAIGAARKVMTLQEIARVIGISTARYYAWVEADAGCALPDTPSCPRTKPTQLTFEEIHEMHEMVTSKLYRHMSVRALALHAQRMARVFAHPGTWCRMIREHAWVRPRKRLYPAKPKVGLRASAPNEAWHLDRTVIKLLDGTKTYLSCIIDNFSRRILAWQLTTDASPAATFAVLMEAARCVDIGASKVKVYVDDGRENKNRTVDPLFDDDDSVLKRVIAQIDVSFSNSMIEAFFSRLKHGWLYLNDLQDFATLEKLISFYVLEHNTVMPHAAFNGQTPNEMYFGGGDVVLERIAQGKLVARKERLEKNRSRSCEICPNSSGVVPQIKELSIAEN